LLAEVSLCKRQQTNVSFNIQTAAEVSDWVTLKITVNEDMQLKEQSYKRLSALHVQIDPFKHNGHNVRQYQQS
jgi:hypothetical protein